MSSAAMIASTATWDPIISSTSRSPSPIVYSSIEFLSILLCALSNEVHSHSPDRILGICSVLTLLTVSNLDLQHRIHCAISLATSLCSILPWALNNEANLNPHCTLPSEGIMISPFSSASKYRSLLIGILSLFLG